MRLNKLLVGLIFVSLTMATFVFRAGVVHAQNPAGPPDGVYPAYNWGPGAGSGWNYSVPQDLRYPPAVGWDPIANVYNGTNPSGNIEDLCRGSKKLLVPNMGTAFLTPGYGTQTGPWSYKVQTSSIYIEYWAAAYQCWNSPADEGTASLWGTGMEIDINGAPASINTGTYDGVSDPDRGGWGGNWSGWGGSFNLAPGFNQICMKLWGNYQWLQGGVYYSEPVAPLGFGCLNVWYDRPVNGGLYDASCDLGDFTYIHRNNQTYTTRASVLGSLQDPDFDWTQAHVYIDDGNGSGPSQFVGSYDASQYPLNINGNIIGAGKPPYGTGVPSWHDWFVVPKTDTDRFVRDGRTHTLYVYGIGRDPGGATNGDNREIFLQPQGWRLTIGPCDRQAIGGLDSWACDLGDFKYAHRNNNVYDVEAGLLGWMQDPDWDYTVARPTNVHVYAENVNPGNPTQQVFVGDYEAGKYPISLNGVTIGAGVKPPYGTGVPSWHDWFVMPKTDMDNLLSDRRSHILHVYAIGKKSDGTNSGENPEIFKQPGNQRASVSPCLPPDGTIHTSKYEPPSHLANGVFTDVDNQINDAKVCLTNPSNVTFACSNDPGRTLDYRQNGWWQGNIWSDFDYKVTVDVPVGWKVTSASVFSNGVTTSKPVTCGATTCWITGVRVTNGALYHVNFWYDRVDPPVCGAVSLLDPSANNNPFASTPEAGNPITVDFGPPTNLQAGTTQYSISNIVVSPGGSTGLTGNQGPTNINPPNNIRYTNVIGSNAAVYNFTYTVTLSGSAGGSYTLNCSGSFTTAKKPYLRVYGNDVRAGGAFAAANGICTTANPKATILAFSRGWPGATAGTENRKGSSTQFAAFALGEISEFMSAGQNSPRTNTPAGSSQTHPVLDLTFGNYDPTNSIGLRTPSADASLYDMGKVEGYGGLSGMENCTKDFYTAISTGGGTQIIGNTVTPGTRSGATAEYHDGDVMINGNIDFPASWADGSAPSYYLAVKGDIYIQPGVYRLAGVYIAQPDPVTGQGGHIYTCAHNLGLYSGGELNEACNNVSLTVNGAFIAQQVKFQRTIETLRNGTANESASTSKAAEIFDFSPEVYIANPHGSLRNGSSKVQYDFITSLPPIL